MTRTPQTCLVIKNDGIGDLIASSGIIASLASHFEGGVDLVTCEQNRELAGMLHGVRHVYYVSRDALRFVPIVDRLGLFAPVVRGRTGWARDFTTLAQLHRREYDVAISLRRFIRASSLVVMRACRAQRRLAAFEFCTNLAQRVSDRAAAGWQRFYGPSTVLSEQAYYALFLRETLGIEVDVTPRLQLPASDAQPRARRVGVCLSGASMRWSTAHWVELIGELCAAGWEVVLFGGSDCERDARIIQAAHPQCESRIGQLGFAASVPVLRSLGAYVGNDTGFSHFASLIVPRCLILTGGGTHGRFFPWQGAANQYVVYFGLDCFDCDWRCKYPRHICLDQLEAHAVLQSFVAMTSESWLGPTWRNLNPVSQTYSIAWRHKANPPRGSFDDLPR
jgi:ADP-heptose:LPS heptosyltransferase